VRDLAAISPHGHQFEDAQIAVKIAPLIQHVKQRRSGHSSLLLLGNLDKSNLGQHAVLLLSSLK
jgi:hypothetical protein